MHHAAACKRVILGFTSLLVCSTPALAQDSGYVAGAGIADVRLFDGTTSRTPLFSDPSRDATAAGGSIRVGTWVHPRWTLEVGADVTSKTSTTTRGPVIAIFPSVPPLEITSSTSFVSVTTMVGFHSPAGRRVRLGYLAGFSFVRATCKTDYSSSLAALVDGATTLASFSFDGITIPTFPRSSITLPASAFNEKRNSGALTLGFEAAIDLTPRIAIVPELRASTLSGVFLVRPGVGARWKF
jgi:hypothetical protein